MHVAAVLKRKGSRVVSTSPTESVEEVARLLTRERIGAAVVMEGDRLAGILSERDIVRAIAAEGAAALSRTAADLMTREVRTGRPGDTVAEIMALMTERRIRHVPILDDDRRMLGVVSIGDVVKARLDETELEVDSLRGFVAAIG